MRTVLITLIGPKRTADLVLDGAVVVLRRDTQTLGVDTWAVRGGGGQRHRKHRVPLLLWKGPGVVSKAYAAQPEVTVSTRFRLADALGADGVGEGADPASQMANPQITTMAATYARELQRDPARMARDTIATRGSAVAIRTYRIDPNAIAEPPAPAPAPAKIIVVKRLPSGRYELCGG